MSKVNKTTDMKAYKKDHYQKNKSYILDFHKQRVNCPKCNKEMAYSSRANHMRLNRCKFLMDLVGNIVVPVLPTDYPDLISPKI